MRHCGYRPGMRLHRPARAAVAALTAVTISAVTLSACGGSAAPGSTPATGSPSPASSSPPAAPEPGPPPVVGPPAEVPAGEVTVTPARFFCSLESPEIVAPTTSHGLQLPSALLDLPLATPGPREEALLRQAVRERAGTGLTPELVALYGDPDAPVLLQAGRVLVAPREYRVLRADTVCTGAERAGARNPEAAVAVTVPGFDDDVICFPVPTETPGQFCTWVDDTYGLLFVPGAESTEAVADLVAATRAGVERTG